MSDFEFIQTELNDNIFVIRFNRPDCYNAMNVKMKGEIVKAIKLANRNEQCRSIVLTGNGKAFSSGQDLNDRTVSADEGPVDLGRTLREEWNPLINAIRKSELPVIAAINGVCAGAGLSVAMACDFKYANSTVKLVSGFSQIGLTLDAGMDHTLTRALGHSRAMEFGLLGKPLTAGEALDVGLVNSVSEEFFEQAMACGRKIGSLPPLSVKIVKKNLLYAQDASFEDVVARETTSQRFLGNTEDYAEGVDAFFNKRKPQFKGR